MKSKTRNTALILTVIYLFFSVTKTLGNVTAPLIFINRSFHIRIILNLLKNALINGTDDFIALYLFVFPTTAVAILHIFIYSKKSIQFIYYILLGMQFFKFIITQVASIQTLLQPGFSFKLNVIPGFFINALYLVFFVLIAIYLIRGNKKLCNLGFSLLFFYHLTSILSAVISIFYQYSADPTWMVYNNIFVLLGNIGTLVFSIALLLCVPRNNIKPPKEAAGAVAERSDELNQSAVE